MCQYIEQMISIKQFIFIATLSIVVYFAVFVSVIIDMYSARRRSRRLGIRTKSNHLRRSIRKFNDYVVFILMATIIDFLLYLFQTHEWWNMKPTPLLTLGAGIVAITIELKSVWENTDRDRRKDIALAIDNLTQLARTRGEADEIISLIKTRLESETDGHNQDKEKNKL